jgi:hypothetical protein
MTRIDVFAPIKQQILQLAEAYGSHGITCDFAEEMLSETHQTVSARIRELVQEEKLLKTPGRRLTRRNCKARVYVSPAVLTP